MRNIFPNREIPHLWMHRTQPSATNAQGSFSFNGDSISSYAAVIGRHVTGSRKRSAVFLSTQTWSVTTSRHLSLVRGAIPIGWYGLKSRTPIFWVDNPLHCPRDCFGVMQSQIIGLIRWLGEPPSRTRKLTLAAKYRNLVSTIETTNTFAEYFGIRQRVQIPNSLDACRVEANKAIEKGERALKRTDKRAAAREVKRLAAAKLWLIEWMTGDRNDLGYQWQWNLPHLPEAYLRIKGDEVQTTQGAIVPLAHVRAAMPLVLDIIHRGKAWQPNGHTVKLGPYVIDCIDANGTVIAGCHRFLRSEIERFDKVLNDWIAEQTNRRIT